ncbi:Hypothetical_protein [Hexamita inflata]|uniref:Hypothetical_protein n=1 Tax=Hexamita inflata TaxID=28002 RepID=A0AA86UNM3_9EUKA|nr:Hypothetical protein HINF_LOCUS33408 [Hexamita inflata]
MQDDQFDKLFELMDDLRAKQKIVLDRQISDFQPQQPVDEDNIDDKKIIQQGNQLVEQMAGITKSIQNIDGDVYVQQQIFNLTNTVANQFQNNLKLQPNL